MSGLWCEDVVPFWEEVIYGPPSSHGFVQQLPADLVAKLGSLDEKVVAAQWAATMSTPEHTHSASGVKLSDGWTESQAQDTLNALGSLARPASSGQPLNLITEA